MAALQNQPDNINFLSPVGGKFTINRLPTTTYFLQSVNVPGVNAGITEGMPTPFKNLPVSGDHLTFGELQITFRVDEDLRNYIELYNWMRAYLFPTSFDDGAAIYANEINKTGPGVYSDATLVILNSSMNPNVEVRYQEIFPTSLSDLIFDTRDTEINYLECTASFQFKDFTLHTL